MSSTAELLARAVELHRRGELQAAGDLYVQIVDAEPLHAEAWHLVGLVASQLGDQQMAYSFLHRAVQLRPDVATYQAHLALVLLKQRRLDEALHCCRQTLEVDPRSPLAHMNLGLVLREQGELQAAIDAYREAICLYPDYADAYNNLGNALREAGSLIEAGAVLQQALRCRPDFPEAQKNLGNVYRDQDRLDDAVAAYARSLELRPDDAETLSNLADVLQKQARFPQALAICERAIELDPQLAEPHLLRADTWLLLGDFVRGWPEYEWRWKSRGFEQREFSAPPWNGESLEGRTILLHAEQGLGDTLQFIRYVSLVRRRGGRVLVECQRPLKTLLKKCGGVEWLIARGDPLPDFDCHAPLLSLPRIFATTLDTVPADVPYLTADPQLTRQWRDRLAEWPGFKIGIFWQGNRRYRDDRLRSFPLACFEPVAATPGVRLVSLQKGDGSDQVARLEGRFPVLDFTSRMDEATGPFMDTAAVIQNLDLVITADSALTHLAGALGAPVWKPLTLVPDWRNLWERDDSPWYPQTRLFRQRKLGDWGEVFARMAAELRATIGEFG